MLFYGGGDDARRPDAVAAHDEGMTFAVFAGKFSVHGGAVFGAQFEDVTDFDAATFLQATGTAALGVAGAVD